MESGIAVPTTTGDGSTRSDPQIDTQIDGPIGTTGTPTDISTHPTGTNTDKLHPPAHTNADTNTDTNTQPSSVDATTTPTAPTHASPPSVVYPAGPHDADSISPVLNAAVVHDPDATASGETPSNPEPNFNTETTPDTPGGPDSPSETSAPPEEPSLVLSREQTPDPDSYASDASSSSQRTAHTSGSDSEDYPRKRPRATLARDRATVHSHADADYDPLNPAGVRKERVRKRVAGKVIEKLWTPLDRDSYKSFENLCDVSLNKVLERYGTSAALRAKVLEARRVLTHHWLSDKNMRSFLARLHVTKLPPLKSLHVRMKGSTPNELDPLSIDLVLHKKAVCETYLLAELKQLEALEVSYRALQAAYDLDSKYLQDFTKTTAALHAHIAEEKQDMMKQLHLDTATPVTKNIQLTKQPLPFDHRRFRPNDDADIQLVLQQINRVVDDTKAPVRDLLEFCDQLDLIQNKLNARLSPL